MLGAYSQETWQDDTKCFSSCDPLKTFWQNDATRYPGIYSDINSVICVPYVSRHMFLTHIRTISDICGWCIRHWNRTRRRRWRKVRDPYLTGGESVTSFCRSDSRHIVWTSIVYNIYCINTRTHTHINVKNPNMEEIWLRILLLHRLQNASNDFRQLKYSWLQSISVLRDSLGSRQ